MGVQDGVVPLVQIDVRPSVERVVLNSPFAPLSLATGVLCVRQLKETGRFQSYREAAYASFAPWALAARFIRGHHIADIGSSYRTSYDASTAWKVAQITHA